MLKNVIVVCDYAYVEGGAAKVAIQTALALSRETNLNVYFFAGCGDICDELRKSKVNAISLGMPDLLGNPNKLDAIRKGIYNRQAGVALKKLLFTLEISETVVHVHTWTKVLSSSIFKVCNELKVRTFLTVHDYFLVCPNGACYNYVTKEICKLKPMSLKCLTCNCDARSYPQKIWRCLRQFRQNKVIAGFNQLNYITISKFQEKQLCTRNEKLGNVYLVKNIIDIGIDKFVCHPEENELFVFVGRVTKEKGTDLFCEAITIAGVKGMVVGDGPLKEELHRKYPNILFVGWKTKKEIDEILKSTRALIFSSVWYEGSPLTIPEVQAHGIPCIVTNCNSGIDDIVQGENGEIVSANVDEMAAAINRFKNDDYVQRLSRNTCQMFDENRGSEKWYVDNLLKIYVEIERRRQFTYV